MTITARTVPKFCDHIRAALPEIFFLGLISLVISGTIEPWPECQPEESYMINWLWLKPGIGMPGGIPGDSSHHPNWLWLLAIAGLGSQHIARV